MARNGGSFAAARAMYRQGEQQEAQERAAQERQEKAAKAKDKEHERELLKTTFPAAYDKTKAMDDGYVSSGEARKVVEAEEAKRQRAAVWSPQETLHVRSAAHTSIKASPQRHASKAAAAENQQHNMQMHGLHTAGTAAAHMTGAADGMARHSGAAPTAAAARTTYLAQLEKGRRTLEKVKFMFVLMCVTARNNLPPPARHPSTSNTHTHTHTRRVCWVVWVGRCYRFALRAHVTDVVCNARKRWSCENEREGEVVVGG